MKEFDRVKDGDEYMYTIDGEPALWGDEEAFGLVRDWEKRYEEAHLMHWQQGLWNEILRDKLPTAKRIGDEE